LFAGLLASADILASADVILAAAITANMRLDVRKRVTLEGSTWLCPPLSPPRGSTVGQQEADGARAVMGGQPRIVDRCNTSTRYRHWMTSDLPLMKKESPMKKQVYRIGVDIEVLDPDLLFEAAREQALKQGYTAREWAEARENSSCNDLRILLHLLDPYIHPPGCAILESWNDLLEVEVSDAGPSS
jgi:hypothetical protein